MGRFLDAFKAGAKFVPGGNVLLNTRARSAFNVDWADPTAAVLICAECGRIEWFANEPEEVSE